MIALTPSKSDKFSPILSKILVVALLSLFLSIPLPSHASTKTLLLFPLVLHADQTKAYLREGVKSMLVSRLSGEGLEVVSDEGFEPLLIEKEKEGIISKERAEELARRLEADYAIFGSIMSIGRGYSLDLSILELREGESRLTRVSEALDEDQFIPGMADMADRLRAILEGKEIPPRKRAESPTISPEVGPAKGLFSKLEPEDEAPMATEKGLFFKSVGESRGFKPSGRIPLRMTVMAFDMGDLDGAGGLELVVLGRKKLLLYERRGTSFALKDSLEAGLGEDFLKVSLGDRDHNGRAEVYLVSLYGRRARSTVLEWTGGFKRLDRRIGHMRVVKDSGGGRSLLLFQNSEVGQFFSGTIYVVNSGKQGQIAEKERLSTPKGVQFYTFAFHDLNQDGKAEWLGLGKLDLDEYARLYVWDQQGNILWRGTKKLGGTNNVIRSGGSSRATASARIPINSRLVVTDIDGDGKKEILAIKNIPLVGKLQNFKVFKKGNLTAYRIEETSLFPGWTTRDIPYCLTDMQAMGETLFLAAQKGRVSNIGEGSGRIMWFE